MLEISPAIPKRKGSSEPTITFQGLYIYIHIHIKLWGSIGSGQPGRLGCQKWHHLFGTPLMIQVFMIIFDTFWTQLSGSSVNWWIFLVYLSVACSTAYHGSLGRLVDHLKSNNIFVKDRIDQNRKSIVSET